MAKLSEEQEMALMQETQLAIFLVHQGLLSLRVRSLDDDYYRLPLVLVAQGFERLMKLVLVTGDLKHRRSLPTRNQIKSYLHDLVRLTEKVIELAESTGYAATAANERTDLEMLGNDPAFRELLAIMTDLSEGARYSNLDTLLGRLPNTAIADPIDRLRRLRRTLSDDKPELWGDLILGGKARPLLTFITREYTAILQRAARALCRLMMAYTPFDEAGPLAIFLDLENEYEVPPLKLIVPVATR